MKIPKLPWYAWLLIFIIAVIIPGGLLAMMFVWPVSGRLSSIFGNRVDPLDKTKTQFHNGIDIAAPLGSPVLAAMDGTVERSYTSDSYGERIILKHDGGIETTYNHMSCRLVKNGATVKQGENIGIVGSTGKSTGPHLHFEVKQNGVFVNPEAYLTGVV